MYFELEFGVSIKIKTHIIGLGNPGTSYTSSPHNLGFMLLDRILEKCTIIKSAETVKQKIWITENIVFSKPKTYMNLSGQVLKELHDLTKMNRGDFVNSIIVLHDDITLPMHQIKYKDGAINPGLAGHNGLRSLADALMKLGLSKEEAVRFKRIRLGCDSRARAGKELHQYVTQPMSKTDLLHWETAIDLWLGQFDLLNLA